ncbi:YraN family protein [Candidatus Kaiserbacteria bacterium]|nr:YraN family protein [Candidatus Kaiserbacteria bacterium]
MSKISHNEVGKLGEKTASMFLMKRGFNILEQNYWKKWGEIDIIAKNKGKLHFIEVKTVSRENIRDVSRETIDEYRPEDNLHEKKLKRLSRTIQTYLLEKDYEGEWQFDVVAVFLDIENREAKCRYIEDVII